VSISSFAEKVSRLLLVLLLLGRIARGSMGIRPIVNRIVVVIIISIIIKGIYIAQVRKGHKCAMSAEMAVWLRNFSCCYDATRNS